MYILSTRYLSAQELYPAKNNPGYSRVQTLFVNTTVGTRHGYK